MRNGKLKITVFLLALFVALGTFALVGCKKKPTEQPPALNPSITLSRVSATLDLTEELLLTAQLHDLDGTVEWSSSDESAATVDQSGLVRAVSDGVAEIKAACGDYFATCTVTVSSGGQIPVLKLNGDNSDATVMIGDWFAVSASLYYNNSAVNEAEFNYSVEDSEIAEVDESTGEVTAKKAGKTEVVVKAKWRSFEIYKTINLTVKNATYINTGATEITLYTSNFFGDKTTESLDVSVIKNGSAIAGAQPEFNYDTGALKIEDGTLSLISKEEGDYEISLSYNAGEDGILTASVTVHAVFPIGEYTTKAFDLETMDDTDPDAAFAGLFADGSRITDVYDTEAPDYNAITSDNKLALKDDLFGERVWTVRGSNGYGYNVSGSAVTKYIDNEQDFVSVFLQEVNSENRSPMWTSDSSKIASTQYGGYYVLTRNLSFDSDEKAYSNTRSAWALNNGVTTMNAQAGFNGVFDGNGFTVSGLTVGNSDYNRVTGIFSTIGVNGVVKNVAFVNGKISGKGDSGVASYLTNALAGTLENVFIHIDIDGSAIGGGVRFNALAYGISPTAAFSNCVVYFTGSRTSGGLSQAALANMSAAKAADISSGYAVYDNAAAIRDDAANKFFTIYTVSELSDTSTTFSASFDDNEYWTTKNNLPVFESAKDKISVDLKASYGVTIYKERQSGEYEDATAEFDIPALSGVVGETVTFASLNIPIGSGYVIDESHSGSVLSGTVAADGSLRLIVYLKRIQVVTATQDFFALKQTDNSNNVISNNYTFALVDDYALSGAVTDVKINGVSLGSDAYSHSGNTLTVNNSAFAELTAGESFTVTVSSSEKNVEINVGVLATFAVTKPSDINAGNANTVAVWQTANGMKQTSEWNSNSPSGQFWGGYIVLANDIDFGGARIQSKVACHNQYGGNANTYGFRGTFDGLGHAIKNFIIHGDNQSLFGWTTSGAVIKNAQFLDFHVGGGYALGLFDHDCRATVDGITVRGAVYTENARLLGRFYAGTGKILNSTVTGYIGGTVSEVYEGVITVAPNGNVTSLDATGTTINTLFAVPEGLNGVTVNKLSAPCYTLKVAGEGTAVIDNPTDLTITGINGTSLTSVKIFGYTSGVNAPREVATSSVTLSGGTLTIPATALGGLYGAGLTVLVTTDAGSFAYNCDIVSYIITGVDDIHAEVGKARFLNAMETSGSDNNAVLSGYVVLGANIDCGGETIRTGSPCQNASTGWFGGIFNGREHTISDMDISSPNNRWGQFFGSLHANGIVKNVRFEKVTKDKNQSSFTHSHGFFGLNSAGTVQNVYIEVTSYKTSKTSLRACIGNFTNAATIKDCTFIAKGAILPSDSEAGKVIFKDIVTVNDTAASDYWKNKWSGTVIKTDTDESPDGYGGTWEKL